MLLLFRVVNKKPARQPDQASNFGITNPSDILPHAGMCCSYMGPHLGTQVPLGYLFQFLVPKGFSFFQSSQFEALESVKSQSSYYPILTITCGKNLVLSVHAWYCMVLDVIVWYCMILLCIVW